jgi:hypothetical protein
MEDKIIATQIKRTKQAIWIVKDTWEDALKTEGELGPVQIDIDLYYYCIGKIR